MGAAEDDMGRARMAAFIRGLDSAGWRPDGTVRLHVRWGGGVQQELDKAAGEIVAESPNVILANSARAVAAINRVNRQIPVVFVATADPVGQGLVTELARPGGNLTGFSLYEFSIVTKMLDLLKAVAPKTERVLFVANRNTPSFPGWVRELSAATARMSLALDATGVGDSANDMESKIDALAAISHAAVVAPPDVFISTNRARLIAATARNRVPAIYGYSAAAREGGLMSYGSDIIELFNRASVYVDRILKGEQPSSLPVQHPTKFELAINLKAAKALGLDVPTSVLLSADEVIE